MSDNFRKEPDYLHVDIHLHIHESPETSKVLTLIKALAKQGVTIMSALTNLSDAVAANTSVVDSAVALLQGLKAKLDEAIASGDPAAIQAFSDSLAADTAELADAVAANTPADPAPIDPDPIP